MWLTDASDHADVVEQCHSMFDYCDTLNYHSNPIAPLMALLVCIDFPVT
jgi:hypothetical protein